MTSREALVEAGRGKSLAPFTLDEELTFFCPQENLEALDLPVVQRAHAAQRDWGAARGDGGPAVLLLLPCQARKPYPLSAEHLAVNRALLAAGWAPEARGDWPRELAAHVDDERLLSDTPLHRDGVRLDRATISEPFALVPYAWTYAWEGGPSPFSRYDDPGLFEHRGIEPTWRADCTATDGRWGASERAAYAATHERLVQQLAAVLRAASARYGAMLAYIAPALTHRSFLGDAAERAAAGFTDALPGVGDLEPGLVELVPSGAELARLGAASHDPLSDALEQPEALSLLTERLDAAITVAAA